MTNNQLTDERISDISDYFIEMQDHYSDPADRENFEIFRDAELLMKELQERRKAERDSEPVAWSNGYNKSVPAALRYLAEKPRTIGGESSFNTAHLYQLAREIEFMAEAPLYRHAQQPVVPEEKPMPNTLSMYAVDAVAAIAEVKGWNACRAAMLQELQKSAGAEEICRSSENEQDMQDMQAGNSPVIPDGWQVEAEKLAEMHGMSFVLFRHGEAPQCADPTKVVISFTDKGLGHDMLPAAPQEVKGE